MNAILQETEAERQAIDAVKSEVERQISAGSLTLDELADRLELFPAGAASLLMRTWSLPEAFRIADILGIDFAEGLSPRD